jgi:hypothetical protein
MVSGERRFDPTDLFMGIGGLVACAGPLLFLAQCFVWLKSGVWYPLEVQTIWFAMEIPLPHVNWIGLQQIIDWVMKGLLELPLSVAVFFFGIAIIAIPLKLFRGPSVNPSSPRYRI